jgi:hypothetical protein
MKIRLAVAEFFLAAGRTDGQADRWTQMTKLIDDFRNFAKTANGNFIIYKDLISCITKTQLRYSLF